MSEDRTVSRRHSSVRLFDLLVRATAKWTWKVRASDSATPSESLDVAVLAAQLDYLRWLHERLPHDMQSRVRSRLLDAFAWGVAAFLHDKTLRRGPVDAATMRLNEALHGLRKHLNDHRVKLPTLFRLVKRAEARHADISDAEHREATELGITRAAARALHDFEQPPGRGRSAADSAGAVGDELSRVWDALGAPAPRHEMQISQHVLTAVLEPALDELVRWGSEETDAIDHVWSRLFIAENAFRDQARLPLKERYLALGVTPAQVVSMLQQPTSDASPTGYDEAIDRIGLALDAITKARLRAVRNLERKLKEPEPPADSSVVLSLVSLALSVAVAGVGGLIASYVVGRVAGARATRAYIREGTDPQLAPAAMALDKLGVFGLFEPIASNESHLDEALSEAVETLVGGVIPIDRVTGWLADRGDAPPDAPRLTELTARLLRDPRNVFVAGLERGLEFEHDRARITLAAQRVRLHHVALDSLGVVEQRLRRTADRAEDVQLYVAMIEWMNFAARWRHGPLAGTVRGAMLGEDATTLAGCVTVDCVVDREDPRTGPVVVHDARAGIESGVWKAIQSVAGAAPIGTLPLNQIYRFFLGTPAPAVSTIRVRVYAPPGTNVSQDDYDGEGRRALAAAALDLPFSPALDGAIRHGRQAPHDEGVALAKRLERVPVRDLLRVRRGWVAAARSTPTGQVRGDG